jgi:hypothetical protein
MYIFEKFFLSIESCVFGRFFLIIYIYFDLIFFSVNLSGDDKVDITHFDLLKVLGTGGKC